MLTTLSPIAQTASVSTKETRARSDVVDACSALKKQKYCKDNADCIWDKDDKTCVSLFHKSP